MIYAEAHPPLLEMRGIRKSFPGLTALDDVNFTVKGGEIHALIGQNGAGKSTLMKVLAGVYNAEEGRIFIDGQLRNFRRPDDALRAGIGVVYQDLSLVPQLSVADNIFLGREPGGFVINESAIHERCDQLLRRLGVGSIDSPGKVESLPLAQQQLVAIAKVLAYEPRILVLDEPTAALAENEVGLLLNILRRLRSEGIGIVYISHRFKEVLKVCDRATVLRNGSVVGVTNTMDIDEDHLIELTIGDKVESFFRHHTSGTVSGEVALEVSHLSVDAAVQDVSFELRRGEIIGITGLLGAGQNELARALFGLASNVSGTLTSCGHEVVPTSPKEAIRLGIGLLTDQRKIEGLVQEMSVLENISLASLTRLSHFGAFMKQRRELQATRRYINQLNIKTPSTSTKVKALSGGNQQKVVLAKWLERDPNILICISPTQGVDVGAKAEIYAQLAALAARGKAILIVSEDHLEVLNVCDRILVMHQGRLLRNFHQERDNLNEERLLSTIQGN